jgi:hypothetical protein
MGGACSVHAEMRNAYFWLENLKGRDHSKDTGVDRRINI